MANSRKLTVFEEEVIVSFIIDLDVRSFPPRYSYVEDMANRMLAQRGGGRVGPAVLLWGGRQRGAAGTEGRVR